MGFFRSQEEQHIHENAPLTHEEESPPEDRFHLAYVSYFIMGTGFLLPWNAFITAVDYFTYIYPGKQVDTVFSVAYMIPALVVIVLLLTFAGKANARVRINIGLSLFLLALLVVPVMDVAYIKGQRGLDDGYFITVAAVVSCGIADAIVQGSLIGSAGELPEQYMQAVVAGTAASGPQENKMPMKKHHLPMKKVDRVFSVAYMIPALGFLLLLLTFAARANVRLRINLGLSLFLLSLLIVPVMDVTYIKGQRGLNGGYSITVAAVVLCAIADALVQGSLIGSAGELPEQYMQAVVAGTAASGVLVSALRILTKAALPQNVHGLRTSANLYFAVSIVFMALCLISYNMANRLPVIMYYNGLKTKTTESTFLLGNTTVNSLADPEDRSLPDGASVELYGAGREGEGLKFWHVLKKIKWLGLGILLIYLVTLSIFPGYITEDVHSHLLKDWYPILLITCYNIFDLVGKSLTAYLMLESAAIAIGGSVARLLFFPLFYACLHGPHFFHTEIPVVFLTCLLGLTNGYFTSVVMIIAPKTVPLQESETAGITIVLFLVIGLAIGSIVGWFWVI